MPEKTRPEISFVRLREIPPDEIIAHMSDPRVGEHMPLLDFEWDYGLVLKSEHFGLGVRISRKMIAFAKADTRISYILFLLPPSRKHLGGLDRLGAKFVENVDAKGARFLKYRLDTV